MKKISLLLSTAVVLAVIVMSACNNNVPVPGDPPPAVHDKFFGTWKSTNITGNVDTDNEVVNAMIPNLLPKILATATAEFTFEDGEQFSSHFVVVPEEIIIDASGSYTFDDQALSLTTEVAAQPQEVPYLFDGKTALTLDYAIDPEVIKTLFGEELGQINVLNALITVTLEKE
ncbi:MAG: DUF5004 domain-containing protein [Prevotellaceae bacterium]|jgi:hypothetical protein|nr:DUF5004 domain-containing protein [Prevotellaceae bacterium]